MSTGPDDRDEGFLARWSRRKRIAVEDSAPKADAGATGPLPPASGGEGLGMGGRKAELALSNEAPSGTASHDPPHRKSGVPDLRHPLPMSETFDMGKRGEGEETPPQAEPEIEPPSLDLIDKDFDLAHWLKQNVPESWKLAALRRAWLADPTIRNYENPARDYALDWNTPGGAPGYGPLTESDDVEAMVRAIFGETPEAETTAPDVAAGAGDSVTHRLSSKAESDTDDAAAQQKSGHPEMAEAQSEPELVSVRLDQAENPSKLTNASFVALQENAASKVAPVRVRKRGGGATPM